MRALKGRKKPCLRPAEISSLISTKGREPLIRPEIRADLFAYLGGIIREMRGTALIINGTADHVHVLARIRPAHSAAQIARVIKTNSSRWVHEKGHTKFAWQAGYGVFSVSESNGGSGSPSPEAFAPRRIPSVL